MKRFALILATVVVQIAVGEDLYWVKNSNWNNPSNWALGRPPCSGEIASFASVPDSSVVFLNTNATVLSIVLPANGTIVLGASVTIRFSQEVDSDCTVPSNSPPMAAEVQNEFIGAMDQWWELPQNWARDDGSSVDRTPCGDDKAIFPQDSAFSFVKSNETVTVSSLTVREMSLQSLQDLPQGSNEFQLDVTINPDCATDPSLCPCLFSATTTATTQPPNVATTTATTQPPNVASQSRNVAGIVVGVLVAILVIIAVMVVLILLAVFFYMRRRGRGFGYAKDELIEPPTHVHKPSDDNPSTGLKNTSAFDNPIYDSEVIAPTPAQPIGYETKPSLEEEIGFETKHDLELEFGDLPPTDSELDPNLAKYEPVLEIAKPPVEYDEGYKDLGGVEEEKEPTYDSEKEVTPVLGKYQRL